MIASQAPAFPPSPVTRSAPVDRTLLARLRFVACACRAGARVDATCTCTTPGAGITPCLRALVSTAPQATGRHLTFYRPGEQDVSFDESWILAMIEAAARNDGDSLRFLVIRHVVPPSRARILFLARRVAEARATGSEGEAEGCEDTMRGDVATS